MRTFIFENYCPALAIALAAIIFSAPVFPATSSNPMDMMDQFDQLDKQDFSAAISKASACTRARNFPCSASELAKAAKAANSGQDKKTLLASQNSLANEKQQLANEIRRAEEERQAQDRRDEEERQARVRRDEEREARRERDERQARDAEDRQSTRDYNAAIGKQIMQGFAQNAVVLNQIDRQTNNAIADSNRVLAAQAAERDRARSEREDREADRRRDAERERSAARARAAEQQAEAPRYQPQVVILPKADVVCPPGSTWYNPTSGIGAKGGTCYVNPQAQGQTRVASNSGSGSNTGSGSDRPVSASGTTTRPPASGSTGGNTRSDSPEPTTTVKPPPKIQWGPVKLESIAICRQGTTNGKWECYGALDNQSLLDEPTLESALARQNCSGGSYAAGGPVLKGVLWDAYRCNHSLGAGDFDIVKRYGMITAQRSYMCPLLGEERCTTPYDGQDKR